MSSSDEEIKEVPLPKHRIRFTDMPEKLQDKAIRCKYLHQGLHLSPHCQCGRWDIYK